MLGCCQQPTKSSGAASFRCFGGNFSPKSLWRAARPGSRCRRGSDTARYLGSEVGKKVAQPTPATRIVDRGRCTLLKQCTYIVRDLGQQPTTWMGTGCCSTGGNQQRSQQCAEQVLQPGNKTARWLEQCDGSVLACAIRLAACAPSPPQRLMTFQPTTVSGSRTSFGRTTASVGHRPNRVQAVVPPVQHDGL